MANQCPDHGPDQGHYYSDENTGDYTGICSCGNIDPFIPREDDAPWPGLVSVGPIDPPF